MAQILITGANGTVGSYLQDELKGYDFFPASRQRLDVSNRDHVRIHLEHYQPDIIVHLASNTSLETCERNKNKSFEINSIPLFYITEYAKPNAMIIVLSSAQVFGDNGRQMPEQDYTQYDPQNNYAYSKYLGEIIAQHNRHDSQTIVNIRTSWIFGSRGNKFLNKLLPKLADGEDVDVSDELKGQLTYGRDIAEFIRTVIDKRSVFGSDTYNLHFTNQNSASRYEIIEFIKQHQNYKGNVNKVNEAYFHGFVKRPIREYLSLDKTMRLFPDFKFRTWEDSILEFLQELDNGKNNNQ